MLGTSTGAFLTRVVTASSSAHSSVRPRKPAPRPGPGTLSMGSHACYDRGPGLTTIGVVALLGDRGARPSGKRSGTNADLRTVRAVRLAIANSRTRHLLPLRVRSQVRSRVWLSLPLPDGRNGRGRNGDESTAAIGPSHVPTMVRRAGPEVAARMVAPRAFRMGSSGFDGTIYRIGRKGPSVGARLVSVGGTVFLRLAGSRPSSGQWASEGCRGKRGASALRASPPAGVLPILCRSKGSLDQFESSRLRLPNRRRRAPVRSFESGMAVIARSN